MGRKAGGGKRGCGMNCRYEGKWCLIKINKIKDISTKTQNYSHSYYQHSSDNSADYSCSDNE